MKAGIPIVLTERELAAVVRALEEPHHTMADGWREQLQAKFRAARSATRRVKPPRLVEHVHAVYRDDGELVDIAINVTRFNLLLGWAAYPGWFVPDPSGQALIAEKGGAKPCRK